jgi:uncharacterized protein YdiU (UPF0061 family)
MVVTSYRPERAILELDQRFHAVVAPADFPERRLRWRNQRWAQRVGLGDLGAQDWLDHFAGFRPLPGSLSAPLALAYHGHQFGHYNPDLGDGRGFLFAQLRDDGDRLLDLGTKGSGQTPWSRGGDGRLTLRGGVREVLAASYLESFGVYTSKAFSVVETGEALYRQDEPSPTRSCVLVRLSHSHVRFGSFQKHAFSGDRDAVLELVEYSLRHLFPGVQISGDSERVVGGFFDRVVQASADLAASWMATGFVHGVLNTDNMVVTGESFDYGPWRFLPISDPNFIAAYFDTAGRYRFGRQPAVTAWNLAQLAGCLSLVADPSALERVLSTFETRYRLAFRQRIFTILGLETGEEAHDVAFLQDWFTWMSASGASWPQAFFDWFCGAEREARAFDGPLGDLYRDDAFRGVYRQLRMRRPDRPERLDHPYFNRAEPVTCLNDDVNRIWDPIAAEDDWSAFHRHLALVEEAGEALGVSSNTLIGPTG